MRYLLHQFVPNLSVLTYICIFRHQITHHHGKVYSDFVEIAMSTPKLPRCNELGDENSSHLSNTKRPPSSNLPLCKSPDEERVLFYSSTPVIHTHISDYFLPNTVSVCMYRPNFLQWYAPHHFLYIPQFPHDPDLYLHPNQKR